MIPHLVVNDTHITELLDKVSPTVRELLNRELDDFVEEITSDARARAAAHIRYLGAKNPGTYVASIEGGVADKEQSRLTGYVRSGHPLAHLMEFGFTISDLTIVASAADVMAFEGDAGTVYAKTVHRHTTNVQPYPAILPAFEARKDEIIASFYEIARQAGQG